MIVTGPRIDKTGFLKDLYNDLSERSVIYDQVHPDPTISQIEEMYQIYQDHDCDSIIAIGGGSNMDAAKALAARVARPDKSLQDMKGQLKVSRQVPFFVAVPTTAGTGSETTIAAVVTDDAENHKYAINDPVLVPDYAVMDPSLTVSLPADITAATGMDALTHAVEAYLSWTYRTEETIDIAKRRSRRSWVLPEAYEQGDSLEAREEMLIAPLGRGRLYTSLRRKCACHCAYDRRALSCAAWSGERGGPADRLRRLRIGGLWKISAPCNPFTGGLRRKRGRTCQRIYQTYQTNE